MDGVVKGLDKAMASMDLEKVLYYIFWKHMVTQGSKVPFSKSHLLATFICKMVAIDNYLVAKKKLWYQWKYTSCCVIVSVIIQPIINRFFNFFSNLLVANWQLSLQFWATNIFFLAMVTKLVPTWRATQGIFMQVTVHFC